MVLGIIALFPFSFVLWLVGLDLGVTSVVFGLKARKEIGSAPSQNGRRMATAGLVMGSIAIALGTFAVFALAVDFFSS